MPLLPACASVCATRRRSAAGSAGLIVLAGSTAAQVTVLDPEAGSLEGRDEVGPSPWRIVMYGRLAYVTTATGLAILDVRSGEIFARLAFQSPVGEPSTGEFRE